MAHKGPLITATLVVAASAALIACKPPTAQKQKVGEKVGKDAKPDPPPVKIKDAKEVEVASVSKIVEGGGDWNAEGNLVLTGPIVIRFDSVPEGVKRFDWSFDRDDWYLVAFLKNDEVVGSRELHVRDNHGRPKGMWRSDHKVPKSAREAGFDAVYIEGELVYDTDSEMRLW